MEFSKTKLSILYLALDWLGQNPPAELKNESNQIIIDWAKKTGAPRPYLNFYQNQSRNKHKFYRLNLPSNNISTKPLHIVRKKFKFTLSTYSTK